MDYNQKNVERFYDIMYLAKSINRLLDDHSDEESVYIGLKKSCPKTEAAICFEYPRFFDVARFLVSSGFIEKDEVELDDRDRFSSVIIPYFSGIKLETEVRKESSKCLAFLDAYKEFMEEEL